ncbi:MAG: NAD(P)H-dependent oxidoreductase subunit E [Alphaproteobacteria bacterium]|nr:NAD(P)H-dependent oxidoreductase subunit E [Alphaproteobacteria bacterium]
MNAKKPTRFHHPGEGRRRAIPHPKGRQIDPDAVEEIRTLLGQVSMARGVLIEHLHIIQDRYRGLSPRHLAALSELMSLSLVEVYEVATFYAHFDVATDNDGSMPDITVRVCESLPCEMAGSEALYAALSNNTSGTVRVLRAPCMGRCDHPPIAEVGHNHIDHATAENVTAAIEASAVNTVLPPYPILGNTRQEGAYAIFRACVNESRSYESVRTTIEKSDLRGMGGAGFPVARKWDFVTAEDGPRTVVINADEGEPGTFKDRWFLERATHGVLEGALIAAWAVDAEELWIYLRDEYPAAREILRREIASIEAAGVIGPGFLKLRRGAGAYICGEESALIESIEGKRGLPRHRPPYVAQNGVFGRPTLVHNVETVFWIREVLESGADWYRDQGVHGYTGARAFSVSGRVQAPGVKIAANGITLNELIQQYCGGMAKGHTLQAYLPGGASGGILPASMADLPLAFGSLEEHGCFVGSGAVVVLSQEDSVRDAAINLMKFFEDESCGQCTPCRVGTEKAVKLMHADSWDVGLLEELSTAMRDASICGLGQAAPNPMESVLRYFPNET